MAKKEGTGSSKKHEMEGKHELYFDCAVGLRGGDAAGNSADDKEREKHGKVLCRGQEYGMVCIGAEHSCHMDLGTGSVYISGECLHKGGCRTLLVSGAECTVPDTVYSLCKKDKGRDAGRDYALRLYVWEISI